MATQLQMRASAEFIKIIDDWRDEQPDRPPRSVAIRRLIENGLKRQGQDRETHHLKAETGSAFDFRKDTANEIIRCMVDPTNLSEYKATAIAKGILDHFMRKQKPAG